MVFLVPLTDLLTRPVGLSALAGRLVIVFGSSLGREN